MHDVRPLAKMHTWPPTHGFALTQGETMRWWPPQHYDLDNNNIKMK